MAGSRTRSQQGTQPDRSGAFKNVQQKSGGAKAFAAGAKHIGGADVAAADRSNILMAKKLDQQVSGRNGTQQVSKRHNQKTARSMTKQSLAGEAAEEFETCFCYCGQATRQPG